MKIKKNSAIKCEIYPDEVQAHQMNKTFGCCRFLWNQRLREENDFLKKNNKFLNKKRSQYKEENPFLNEVLDMALAKTEMNLKEARKRHKNNPDCFGKPQFKAKGKSSDSYYDYNDLRKNKGKGNILLKEDYIRLSKMPKGHEWVKIKYPREIPEDWTLKSATVSRSRSNRYWVSLLFEYELEIEEIEPEKFIGLDYNMENLFVDDSGLIADYPHFLKKYEKKLAREQRKLSHMEGPIWKRGKNGKMVHPAELIRPASKNWEKQKIKVAKIQEKIRFARQTYQHTLSKRLVANNDCICLENIKMKELVQEAQKSNQTNNVKKGFNKKSADNGWYGLTQKIIYKANNQGKFVVKVDKYFASSQICSVCGYKNPEVKDLAIRSWTCPNCNTHHHRDINAAENIKVEGKRTLEYYKENGCLEKGSQAVIHHPLMKKEIKNKESKKKK